MLQARKFASANPDEVTWCFNLPGSSNRTINMGLTKYLTEMSSKYLPEVKAESVRKTDNLTIICKLFV
jgi:hypothetical protein